MQLNFFRLMRTSTAERKESLLSKKNSITLKDKIQVISRIEKGEKQIDICHSLRLPKTTVNTIWKKREIFKCQYESFEVFHIL